MRPCLAPEACARSSMFCCEPLVPHADACRVWLFCRAKSVAIFAVAAGVYWVAVVLEAEPLLACVTAGLVVANRRCATMRWQQFLTDACLAASQLASSWT